MFVCEMLGDSILVDRWANQMSNHAYPLRYNNNIWQQIPLLTNISSNFERSPQLTPGQFGYRADI